ncbi:unnamed protein product [Aureobasidium pullulans]|nr:unnamed protein product [Aureobasidium pullulans]
MSAEATVPSDDAFLAISEATSAEAGLFSRLPLDLLGKFAQHLSPNSAASIALTCRDLYSDKYLRRKWYPALCVGKTPGGDLVGWLQARLKRVGFLKLLWRDLPDHILCGRCRTLHSKDENAYEWPNRGKCSKVQEYQEHGLAVVPGRHLPPWYLEMIMDCDGEEASHGGNLEPITLDTDWKLCHDLPSCANAWLSKSSIEPRVVKDSLMIHACQRLLFTSRYVSRLECVAQIGLVIDQRPDTELYICEHASSHRLVTVLEMIAEFELSPDQEPVQRSFVTDCDDCEGVEFIWTVCRHSNGALEIILDTWRNLSYCSASTRWENFRGEVDMAYLRFMQAFGSRRLCDLGLVSENTTGWVCGSSVSDLSTISLLTAS